MTLCHMNNEVSVVVKIKIRVGGYVPMKCSTVHHVSITMK